MFKSVAISHNHAHKAKTRMRAWTKMIWSCWRRTPGVPLAAGLPRAVLETSLPRLHHRLDTRTSLSRPTRILTTTTTLVCKISTISGMTTGQLLAGTTTTTLTWTIWITSLNTKMRRKTVALWTNKNGKRSGGRSDVWRRRGGGRWAPDQSSQASTRREWCWFHFEGWF